VLNLEEARHALQIFRHAFTTSSNSAGSKNFFRTLPFSLRRRMFGLVVTRGGLLLIASVKAWPSSCISRLIVAGRSPSVNSFLDIGVQEHFVPVSLGRQLVEPALVDLLGRFQVRGAAGLDVFDPVARERTEPIQRARLLEERACAPAARSYPLDELRRRVPFLTLRYCSAGRHRRELTSVGSCRAANPCRSPSMYPSTSPW
jgi:hypothetical protein